MKKLGIMQPYIFPYLGYFQLLNAVDEYVIYDDVQFIKGGWINRNNILIGKQKSLFTIRLRDASSNKMINEIDIQDDFSKFLKSISMAYSKAPQHANVMPLLERICMYEDRNLARFITNSLQEICNYLGIDTVLSISSSLQKPTELHAQEKVIAICQELKADEYYNAIGGKELYDRQAFREKGLELKFLRPILKEYPQFSNIEFTPGLSIIDIMMFNTPEHVQGLLKDFVLE